MLFLIIWLPVALGIALGLKAGIGGTLGKLVASWWVFCSGVLTFVIGWWLVIGGFFYVEEQPIVAFGICGTLLVLAGAVLVPVWLCKLVADR